MEAAELAVAVALVGPAGPKVEETSGQLGLPSVARPYYIIGMFTTRPWPLWPCLALLLVGATGCGDDGETTGFEPVTTEIAVRPVDFLGTLRCAQGQGTLQTYVATLYEYEDIDDTEPELKSVSVAAPCTAWLGFQEVIRVGSRYAMEIDGYDLDRTALRRSGDDPRVLVDGQGNVVTPRWQTQCGASSDEAVLANGDQKVFVGNCARLDRDPNQPAQLAVDPKRVLGDAPCEQAESFDIAFDHGIVSLSNVPCSSPAIIVDAPVGVTATATVSAMSLASPPTAIGTQCTALTRPGEIAILACGNLSDRGNLRVDLRKINGVDDEPLCPAGAFYRLSRSGESLTTTPQPCSSVTAFSFEPGSVLLDVVVSGSSSATAICGNEVVAGSTVTAVCAP